MIARYWHTLRHTQPRQLAWRISYRFEQATGLRRVPAMPEKPLTFDVHAIAGLEDYMRARAKQQPATALLLKAEALRQRRFRFIGLEAQAQDKLPWKDTSYPRLWRYQLHSFAWLRQWAEASLISPNGADRATVLKWLHDWIEQNPVPADVAWDAFCVSSRLINWALAEAVFRLDDEVIRKSYSQQLAWLSTHLEYDLRGNHLLKNAAAIYVAGAVLNSEAKSQGHNLLEEQVREQVLPDGGHIERSPMYQLLVMEDLLAACAVTAKSPAWLKDALQKMAAWSVATAHPDGDIPLFGDSALGESLSPGPMARLTQELGIPPLPSLERDGVAALSKSGYYVVRWKAGALIVKTAGPEPAYLPAHSHADPFSYELSVENLRFVVDAGVHGYAESPWRAYCRSARAHNIATVDGREPMDAWKAFRVGRRYRTAITSWVVPRRGGANLAGRHNGYAPFSVLRAIHADGAGAVWVRDTLEGRGEAVLESRVHLHPDVRITEQGIGYALRRGDALVWFIPGDESRVRIATPTNEPPEGWYFDRFGEGMASSCIVLSPSRSEGRQISYALVQARDMEGARRAALQLMAND
jgi:uncharacterized heparinase superfamily protein